MGRAGLTGCIGEETEAERLAGSFEGTRISGSTQEVVMILQVSRGFSFFLRNASRLVYPSYLYLLCSTSPKSFLCFVQYILGMYRPLHCGHIKKDARMLWSREVSGKARGPNRTKQARFKNEWTPHARTRTYVHTHAFWFVCLKRKMRYVVNDLF